MKKLYVIFCFCLLGALVFPACEGPEGPPGIDGIDGKDGEDGEDGGLFLSTVLEVNITFNEENEFQEGYLLEIPESDNLLIYYALGADEEENMVWMPLPQTLFVGENILIYNYFFTKDYFSIFLSTSTPPGELAAEYTDNQLFRIVVVPGQYAEQAARVDFNDYHAVMKWLGKSEEDIKQIAPK